LVYVQEHALQETVDRVKDDLVGVVSAVALPRNVLFSVDYSLSNVDQEVVAQ
jgi:hypothetical protein